MVTEFEARRIVRSLANQDNEDDERREAAGWSPTEDGQVRWSRPSLAIIQGWNDAARVAGDDGVREAIAVLGVVEAAQEYVSQVEVIVAREASRG